MSAGALSEWQKLPLSLSELCINTTLRCGQSFRWQNLPENQEWRCVLYGHFMSLKQDPDFLYYRSVQPPSHTITPTSDNDHLVRIIKHYFNLTPNLTELYSQWSSQDPNFKKKAAQFTGIRILRQDAWEALISFICSSNNNIARISQMVEKLCIHYGKPVATIEGRAYYDFPPPGALTGNDVESNLRKLGFGYRAKYIYQTALMVSAREKGWLDNLSNPECPAFGVDPQPSGEMKPEGREGYREAHEKLLELQGVGPKVSDCVSLMGLGWGESVPVDTHVWQIAQRDYKFGKSSNKNLNKTTYDAVANHFRKLWGKEAGWAHSVLFTADLRTFADKLAATKKVNVKVKDEESDVKIETKVTTALSLEAPKEEDMEEDAKVKVKVEDIDHAKPSSMKRKGAETIVPAAQTTETRRVSKRLRR
ncbi:8-oxoguanine DNA glycosylase N-terminal [Penicillium coprophilum]|uniref:8-oxoguanine DNA glycosylase N-terminal n=1 Tax=Penicillium coprophilum TaxID=36646 RepID=UPI0023920093|nr:8-oxoguanine DNA glycosylase N-terminal [Penicillium coprophilum]KAJ5164807.1 8-oxoguanine DNA glycosylase N-terminal [Penicillium coprophilum]